MTRIQRQIEKKQEEIRELRRKQAEAKLQKQKAKVSKPKGRPAVSQELLQKAELLAYDNPLPLVAFKLSISLKTLYNYGISRQALNNKIGL